MADVKASALKILANVESNERQTKAVIEQIDKQLEEITKKRAAMTEALKEIEVLKCMLIHVSTNNETAAAVEESLATSEVLKA